MTKLEEMFRRFTTSPTVQQAVAEAEHNAAEERVQLTADHAAAVQTGADVVAKYNPLIEAAAAKTAAAQRALDDTKAAQQDLAAEFRAAKYSAEFRADQIKWRLVQLLPDAVGEVVARLDLQIDRLRDESYAIDESPIITPQSRKATAEVNRRRAANIRTLLDLRSACNSETLAVLPAEELHAFLDRVEQVLKVETN